jgi:L-galactose dehydrogenase/L-glyceraldehyde 3-phosphate reductase
MEQRQLGRTGLEVSVLSFGCGAVGGLMTRGESRDQERAVARALELGITYFDSAALYGNGASETNLGRVLASLKPSQIVVATKVRIPAAERDRIGAAIAGSLEASLRRLGRDHVDIFYCHNTIAAGGGGDTITLEQLLNDALPAFERLRKEGKTRHIGITALGDTPLLLKAADSGAFEVAQICYNALNPSAGDALPANYPAQDYQGLMQRAHKAGMGTVGIRVMAGGALSGSAARHPLAMPVVEPIGSGADYAADVRRAQRLEPLVREGHAASLAELAMRFAIANPALSTTLIGIANLEQFEAAATAVLKGPLSAVALARLKELQRSFVGEAR